MRFPIGGHCRAGLVIADLIQLLTSRPDPIAGRCRPICWTICAARLAR